MNRIHRSLWNDQTATCVAVAENTCGTGKKSSGSTTPASSAAAGARFALKMLTASLMMACWTSVFAEPTVGVVSAGSVTIGSLTAGEMVITQHSDKVSINWQSFSIELGETVRFMQPSISSVALNRVVGGSASNILGNLSSNGKVFLVNPNGILFGAGASVNVGGLVASTRGISDADFMDGHYQFSGAGTGTVENSLGSEINAANGGYLALLGAKVSNDGLLVAESGTVALAAGNAMTLDMAGDNLLSITVSEGLAEALVSNSGNIAANGGRVLMTTQVAGSLLTNTVNNTGVIEAKTIGGVEGSIRLLGGMEAGTLKVAGTLDASATLGTGGFIETSAARVEVGADAVTTVTTLAPSGSATGQWLVGSRGFTVGGTLADNISGASLSKQLVTNNVTISTAIGADGEVVRGLPTTGVFAPVGGGDIDVKEAIAWTASATPTTLTLLGGGDVNIDAAITAKTGNLVVCCGRDINVNAAITTTNGSVLLSAGRDVNIVRSLASPTTAITTTDGNVEICAARDVVLDNSYDNAALMTLTEGSNTAGEDLANLGVALGLTLRAGTSGTGPGSAGGTVTFVNGGLAGTYITTTAPGAPINVFYNPTSYETPTNFSPFFTGTGGPVNQFMLVFPDGGDKTFDGTTATTLSGLKGGPTGVSLVAEPGSTATFDSPAVGTDKIVSMTGYSLAGANAGNYALAVACCGPAVARTSASITAGSSQSAPSSSDAASPVLNPAMGVASAPYFLSPVSWSTSAPGVDVLTVLPAAPTTPTYLVVAAPAEMEKAPVTAPVAVPRAAPRVYTAPVRKPKAERN